MEAKAEFREIPREETDQLHADMRNLLGTKWGRRLMHRILFHFCNLQAPVFDRSIGDGMCAALHNARASGVQAVGTHLLEALQKADPRAYSMLLREEAAAIEAKLQDHHQGTDA